MNKDLLLDYIKENPLLLAPMAGVTDSPFRSFMRRMGASVLTTELVSAFALARESSRNGPSRTEKIAHFTEDQQPVGVQIFGEDAETLSQAAVKVEEMGASFVDLNLGCPVPKIVKKGAGSALLKNPLLLSKILKAIKQKIQIPLTIKIRTGWSSEARNALDIARLAFDEGVLWLTIHGRTRAQGYSGVSDWDYISEVRAKAPLPVIGNGDLVHPQQIGELYSKTGCPALMIGRGCLKNPWLFRQARSLIHPHLPLQNSPAATGMLTDLFESLSNFYDEKMALLQFKKFSVWFSAGFPESALFRKSLFQIKEKERVLSFVFDYFKEVDPAQKKSIPYEPFLLQGHG